MSDTRYGHSNVGGGNQDQGERKDEGWESRQGGSQSRGRGGQDPRPSDTPGDDRRDPPAQGRNTQGDLAGIGEASDEVRSELGAAWQRGDGREGADDAMDGEGAAGRDEAKDEARGTDQPRRMGGPLGPDPENPHLPEGDQNPDTQGTGAGGYDKGVNATHVGAVHQGVKEEQA